MQLSLLDIMVHQPGAAPTLWMLSSIRYRSSPTSSASKLGSVESGVANSI
jgi:hypothetical protein